MRALVLWLVLSAGQAAAEPAIRFESAGDRLDLTPEEISQATASPEAGLVLIVQLDPAAGQKLASFTETHVGEEIVVAVCSEIISRPIIQEKLTGGALEISMPTAGDVARTAAYLMGEINCVENAMTGG